MKNLVRLCDFRTELECRRQKSLASSQKQLQMDVTTRSTKMNGGDTTLPKSRTEKKSTATTNPQADLPRKKPSGQLRLNTLVEGKIRLLATMRRVWPSLWPCILYSASACILQIVNKMLYKEWGFNFVFLLSLIQAVFSILSFFACAALGLVSLPAFRLRTLANILPLALLSVGNVATGQLGLRNVSLPMFLVLRRLVTPTVMVSEYLVWGRRQPRPVVVSLLVISAGSLVAGYSDLTFDVRGYGFTLLANGFTAVYTMSMKGLSSAGWAGGGAVEVGELYLYNAVLAVPLLAALSLGTGEVGDVREYSLTSHAGLQWVLGLSCLLTAVYQLAQLVCTTRNSPLATSVAGNFKDLVGSVVGAVLFDDFVATGPSLAGLSLSLTGAFSFLAFKLALHDAAPAPRRRD
mmetsp:Transcript_18405/g.50763  ORF Transcript_18405/g.50763 Transcript_18405/m.50763 type:complete len:406 (+) Transcript_18405:208-1425(+)